MSKHANAALLVPNAGCPHRCSFCDQAAISGHPAIPTADEVAHVCETAIATRRVSPEKSEIAFFGGSFTALPQAQQDTLLSAAYPYVRAGQFKGIRLSTRPDCVDEAVCARLRAFGVTAVELGAQSMDDCVLARNRRGHTAADTVAAAACIHGAGIELGLQMMTGLPGDTDDGARETLRQLCALSPATLRIYPTQVLRGTLLAKWWTEGTYMPQTLENAVTLCAELLDYAERGCGIPVIRLGLHADASMQAARLAGPYHPAFRELCEGELYLRLALTALQAGHAGTEAVLSVAPAALSCMIGQHKRNIQALSRAGYRAKVHPDPTLPRYAVRLGD